MGTEGRLMKGWSALPRAHKSERICMGNLIGGLLRGRMGGGGGGGGIINPHGAGRNSERTDRDYLRSVQKDGGPHAANRELTGLLNNGTNTLNEKLPGRKCSTYLITKVRAPDHIN